VVDFASVVVALQVRQLVTGVRERGLQAGDLFCLLFDQAVETVCLLP
jgi:hypothetical protein